MTTESTSVPSPSGPPHTGGPGPGRVSLAPPRDLAGPAAPPPRRPPGAPPLVGLPLVVADCAAALLSTALLTEEQRGAVLVVQLVVSVTVLNAHAGLYRTGVAASVLSQLPALAARIAVAWCAAAAVLAALYPQHALGMGALALGAAVQLAVAGCCRRIVYVRRRMVTRNHPRPALVVGTGAAARRLSTLLAQHPEYGLKPVGIAVPAQPEGPDGTDRSALPVLAAAEDVRRAVVRNGVRDAVFIDSGDGADHTALVALFHAYGCATWFIGGGSWHTVTAAGLPAARGSGSMAEHVWGYTCRRAYPPPARRRGTFAKRLLDVLVTAPVLLAVSPVLLACALAVRVCDGPGVLFRQERVGQNGRAFTLLKFRTLRPADEQEAATRWSIANDHRMSTVGSILRRTSMDELPQLWNVLRGDMSLVGPRPERPHFVANFSKTLPGYAARHRMPVGITGLAQVHGLRGDTSIEDRSRFDNHYIDHWSLWQDVCILLRTAVSLIRPAGS
ncbi:sugar transferase [Streptomyces sp. NPDC088725]|uniref:sugar transferase n=1 Tax=Streptomyces sp. NPDC088725 TaxID=3365873 RepID=UPI00382DEA1E